MAVNLKEGAAFVNAQVSLTSKIDLAMNVRTNIVGVPNGVSVDADATVTAAAQGTIGVKGEYTHQIGAIEGVPSVFFIGPVPVVVQPRVPVFLSVTGQVAVGLKRP